MRFFVSMCDALIVQMVERLTPNSDRRSKPNARGKLGCRLSWLGDAIAAGAAGKVEGKRDHNRRNIRID